MKLTCYNIKYHTLVNSFGAAYDPTTIIPNNINAVFKKSSQKPKPLNLLFHYKCHQSNVKETTPAHRGVECGCASGFSLTILIMFLQCHMTDFLVVSIDH